MITKDSIGKNFTRTLIIILGVIIAIFLSLQYDLVAIESTITPILPQSEDTSQVNTEVLDQLLDNHKESGKDFISYISAEIISTFTK